MKKVLSLLLAVSLLVCGLPMAASAASGSLDAEWVTVSGVEGGKVSFNSDDGLIYGFEDSVTSANIPEQINGVTVKGFGTPFSTDNGNIGIQSMTYVKLPSTIAGDTDIGWIQISPKLTTIEIDANHTSFSSTGGVLFDKSKETLLVYPQGKTETSYSIPNSVTKIGENAFIGNVSLTDITIPTSVTQIDNGAFRSCAKLSSIAIPDSVTKIGANDATRT